MIIGNCPYPDCDEGFMIPIAPNAPRFERWTCEKCQRVIWTRHSRWDPWSLTEAEFLAQYDVDEAKKRITKRSTIVVPGPRTAQ